MEDYIDNYRKEVKLAGEEGEVNPSVSKTFYLNARSDFTSAKKKGLMRDMTLEELLEEKYWNRTEFNDELRDVVLYKPYFSASLISKQYRVSLSAIRRLREKNK